MLACERVPLLAPSGSTIGLVTTATALPLNGTTQIVAQVIEPAGTPPHSGTHVTFTTTLGSIQPSEAETDSNGQATVLFRAGPDSGTATITAISGGSVVPSDKVLKILVGTAAVGKIVLNASPAQVPSLGGSSTITAQVFDVNGNGLSAAAVSFSTTAGTLDSTLVTTNGNGIAQVVLTTSVQAVVTASVGATATSGGGTGGGTGGGGGGTTTTTPTGTASASVTVSVVPQPTVSLTLNTANPTSGTDVAFTASVTPAATAGSPIKDVTINFGDGTITSLGAATGSAISLHHVYQNGDRTYTVTLTATDSSGGVGTAVTIVFVQTATPLTVILSATATPAGANTTESFTATVIGLGNAVAVNYHWVFGGTNGTADTTSNQQTRSYAAGSGPFTVSVTVTTSTGAQATGSTVITP